jgi:hypothetical protein
MKISVLPEDLVRRCVWDNYVYYIVGSDKEGEKILKENKEFEISERDALIIGLLKVIETDNLIHKFNGYIVDLLTNKSINNNGQVLIRKKVVDVYIDKFLDKFPHYWNPNLAYKNSLEELNSYVDDFKSGVSKLEIIKIEDKFGIYDFLNSNSIKKLISFNY